MANAPGDTSSSSLISSKLHKASLAVHLSYISCLPPVRPLLLIAFQSLYAFRRKMHPRLFGPLSVTIDPLNR